MFYFEYKMTKNSSLIYYFCALIHMIYFFGLFILTMYTFFLRTSFLDYLENQQMVDELAAFTFYFDKKIGFGIGVLILLLIQVR